MTGEVDEVHRGRRGRLAVFAVLVTICVVGAVGYAVIDLQRYRGAMSDAPDVPQTRARSYADQPRIIFRNTAIGDSYGLVAEVPIADPAAPRAVSDVACDRVDATTEMVSCLRTKRGVVTTYQWLELGSDLVTHATHALAGIPSRTRLAEDGSLVASTSFVSGHSYMQVGFSTATVIREFGGKSLGNLEDFQLIINGKEVAPVDRNIWGVTFASDDNTFYATAATRGTPYLVRGDLDARTLTAVASPAECPSISPDGRRVAYKVDVAKGRATTWKLAVLDLETGERRMLDSGKSSVDDQVEWLDRDTLLFGLPRADEAGVTDVWSLDTRASATPTVFMKKAWSPSVVR